MQPAPRPGAISGRTTPAMTVISLDALGVTSTGGVASVLTALLAASTTPAALLLEELAHTQIRIEVLGRADRELTAAEHYRLDAGLITAGHHRTGLLRVGSGMVAAETSLVILAGRSCDRRQGRSVRVADYADHGEPDRTPLHSSTQGSRVPQWCRQADLAPSRRSRRPLRPMTGGPHGDPGTAAALPGHFRQTGSHPCIASARTTSP
jgi:hypothetical protein